MRSPPRTGHPTPGHWSKYVIVLCVTIGQPLPMSPANEAMATTIRGKAVSNTRHSRTNGSPIGRSNRRVAPRVVLPITGAAERCFSLPLVNSVRSFFVYLYLRLNESRLMPVVEFPAVSRNVSLGFSPGPILEVQPWGLFQALALSQLSHGVKWQRPRSVAAAITFTLITNTNASSRLVVQDSSTVCDLELTTVTSPHFDTRAVGHPDTAPTSDCSGTRRNWEFK
jgi:hypothetical protein